MRVAEIYTQTFSNQRVATEKMGLLSSQRMHGDRTRGDGHKMLQGKLCLDVRQNY